MNEKGVSSFDHALLSVETTETGMIVTISGEDSALLELVEQIQFVRKTGEHVHLMSPEWIGDLLTGETISNNKDAIPVHQLNIRIE